MKEKKEMDGFYYIYVPKPVFSMNVERSGVLTSAGVRCWPGKNAYSFHFGLKNLTAGLNYI